MVGYKVIGLIKKYAGIVAIGGTTLLSNIYQLIQGHTPWLSNMDFISGNNIWIILIVGGIIFSFVMKMVRIIFNGLMIAAVCALFFFHEPVLAYLNSNHGAIMETVNSNVSKLSETGSKTTEEEAEEAKKPNEASTFNSSTFSN